MMNSKKISNKIIGIDLGTTYSCVAIMEGLHPKVISNQEGHKTTPSCVSYEKFTDSPIVGIRAKQNMYTQPILHGFKRAIGRSYSDTMEKGKDWVKTLPYKIVEGKDGEACLKLTLNDGTSEVFNPIQPSSFVLKKLKEAAESYLGPDGNTEIKRAVITVPAYFNNNQREATKQAGELAGLIVERIINEPTAAALSFGFGKMTDENAKPINLLVYDLGGGTFDVTALQIKGTIFQSLKVEGDNYLGGDDFDRAIVDWVVSSKKITQLDSVKLSQLKIAAEEAKKHLCSSFMKGKDELTHTTKINIPYFYGAQSLEATLSMAKYRELVSPLVGRTISFIKKFTKELEQKIDQLIFVGGQTRCPIVREQVEKELNIKATGGVDPDECVACGAAIQGANLSKDISDKDLKDQGIVLLDINHLHLGIEVFGKALATIIPAGATLPAQGKQVFQTVDDYQKHIKVKVYQGDRPVISEEGTVLLGEMGVELENPGLKHENQISVEFKMDVNGILVVEAEDLRTGKKHKCTIDSKKSGAVSAEQIENMKKIAKKYEESDKRNAQILTLKGQIEIACSDLSKEIEKMSLVSPQEKQEYEIALSKGNDVVNRPEVTIDLLNNTLNSLLEAYRKAKEVNSKTPSKDEKESEDKKEGSDQNPSE